MRNPTHPNRPIDDDEEEPLATPLGDADRFEAFYEREQEPDVWFVGSPSEYEGAERREQRECKRPALRVLPRPQPTPLRPLTPRERLARLIIERESVFDDGDLRFLGVIDPVADALDGLDLTEGNDPARVVVRRLLRVFCWDRHLWRDELDEERLHASVKAWARTQGEDGELVAARFRTAWISTAVPEGVEPTAYAARCARCKPTGVMDDFEVDGAPTLTRVCRRLADATAYLEGMLRGVKGPKQDRLPGWALNDKATADLFHTNTRTLAVALAELVDRDVLKVALGWQRGSDKQPARRRRFTAKRHRDAGWFERAER